MKRSASEPGLRFQFPCNFDFLIVGDAVLAIGVPYEAVFISILTCQLSSFFVQNFVQTTSALCKERRQLCTNNDNFASTTTTLYQERRLCKDNDNFVRRTSTLQGQGQLCKDNVDFARTMSTLQRQRRLCHNNVNFVRTSCMTP